MPKDALRKLAGSYGIQTSYRDVDGKRAEAEPEILIAVLRVLGAPIHAIVDVEDALRARRLALSRRVLEPVSVLWDGGVDGLRMTLPVDVTASRLRATLHLENGEVHDWSPSARTVIRRREVEGSSFLQTRLPLPSLPHGFHRLSVSIGEIEAESLIVRAPVRAYRDPARERQWGLFAPLYALGTFSDLRRLMDVTVRHGGGFVATLPFLASFPDVPSPYSPASRLFWNELYIDDHARSDGGGLLDYPELHREQRRRLERRARRERREALVELRKRSPRALDYARFRAAMDEHRTFWNEWPERERNGLIEEGDVDEANVDYHLYCQAAAGQEVSRLAEHEAKLYLDLPLGVHRYGYDTWREREIFVHDVDVGAPPDAVFSSGQNWSFPPVLPEASRRQGHSHLRLVYQHAMRYADVLRIDHVMGLHRQFWIPEGASVAEGVYVRYPADELYAILNIESHRARCELVGENLGIVPEIVNERLARHGLRRLYVMQLTPNEPIPRDSVASLNTHDTELFAGAHPDDPNIEDSLQRALSALMKSPASLVTVTLEDLWLETERQNVPGTTDEYPNWRRRLRYRTDELESRVGETLDTFERT